MRVTKGGLYFLSKQLDERFAGIVDQVLYDKVGDEMSEHRRPHVLIHSDSMGIHWFVPITSNLLRARWLMEQQFEQFGFSCGIHIGEVRGMRMGFMLQKLIPATRRYVDKEYLWGGGQLVLDDDTLAAVDYKFRHLLDRYCTRCVGNETNYALAMYNVMLAEQQAGRPTCRLRPLPNASGQNKLPCRVR